MVAAVLEGKRRILIEARVAGLDPAQPDFSSGTVATWAARAAKRLEASWASVVVLDATAGPSTAAAVSSEANISPLLGGVWASAVADEAAAAPAGTVFVVFGPRSFDDMVATRRVFRAAANRGLPVVVLNQRHDEPGAAPAPREFLDATEAYCLAPLVVAGDDRPAPVRVVVARTYPDPFAVFIDPGRGAYERCAEFAARPTKQELTAAIRAAVDRSESA